MHPVEDGDARVDIVVELDVVFALVGSQQSADVLDDPTLEGGGRGEVKGVELGPVETLPRYDPVATSTIPASAGRLVMASATAALAFLPRPPLRTSAVLPIAASPSMIASMWSVRCVSTRQVRPLDVAACTSAQICAVRRSSATSAANTDWMWTASSSLTSVPVWCTTSSRRTSSAPATVLDLISWRVGPQWTR